MAATQDERNYEHEPIREMSAVHAKSEDKWLTFKIVFESLGIISGISIFVTFLFEYHNYNAAIWGLTYAFFAAVILHVHVCYRKNKLHITYTSSSLKFMGQTGIACSVGVLVAGITYIAAAAIEKQGYQLYGYGYAPAAVFSLMNLKWTVVLVFVCKKYKRILDKPSETTVQVYGATADDKYSSSYQSA